MQGQRRGNSTFSGCLVLVGSPRSSQWISLYTLFSQQSWGFRYVVNRESNVFSKRLGGGGYIRSSHSTMRYHYYSSGSQNTQPGPSSPLPGQLNWFSSLNLFTVFPVPLRVWVCGIMDCQVSLNCFSFFFLLENLNCLLWSHANRCNILKK